MKQNRKQPTDLVERTGPEIFRFESPGDCLGGQLVNIEDHRHWGKAHPQVHRPRRRRKAFQLSRDCGLEP